MTSEVDHEWEYYEHALNLILLAALAAGRSEAEAAALARTSQSVVTRRLADDHFVRLLEEKRSCVELEADLWRRDPAAFRRLAAGCMLSSRPVPREAGLMMHLDWFMGHQDEEGLLQAIGILLSPPHSHGQTDLPGLADVE